MKYLNINVLLVMIGCSWLSATAMASEQIDNTEAIATPVMRVQSLSPVGEGFRRSLYASTGVGASRLIPDNSDISTWSVSDKVNAGGQISIGADINKHFSLELHSADLGSAGVEQFGGPLRGRINYHMHGASALWYAGKNRHQNKRRGMTGFGRLGVAMMRNSPVGDAPYSQRNSTQMLIGAGLEYSTKIGLGLRAEVISFDTDARYAQLALVYRQGRKIPRKAVPIVAVKPEKIETPIPSLAVATVTPVAIVDGDNDGVNDDEDLCQQTKMGVFVDSDGCAVFDGVLEGVTFYSASDRLTPKAQKILDGAAETLKNYPNARVKVDAHTDSQGSEFYNQNLSTRRAKIVVEYLTYKGVDAQNLIPSAAGESQPIASNDTVKGRALNRRVELQAIK